MTYLLIFIPKPNIDLITYKYIMYKQSNHKNIFVKQLKITGFDFIEEKNEIQCIHTR